MRREYVFAPEHFCAGGRVGLHVLDALDDGLDRLLELLHRLRQLRVQPTQQLLLLRLQLRPHLLERPLHLPLGLRVLLSGSPDGLLDLALADEEGLDAAVDLVHALLEFGADEGGGLLEGLDVVVLVLAWVGAGVPWITHSGQMHSHLQSKQKYRISSSGCSPQDFLLDTPLSSSDPGLLPPTPECA